MSTYPSILLCFFALFCSTLSADKAEFLEFEHGYVRAHGGLVYSDSIRSMMIKGETTAGAKGESTNFTLLKRRPNFLRVTLETPAGESIIGYNGITGWAKSPSGKVRDLQGAELFFIEHQARFVSPLMNIRDSRVQAEVLDPTKIDGQPVRVIRLRYPSGIIETVYLDAETWLETRIETQTSEGGPTLTSDYKKWETFDKLPMATLIENRQGDTLISTTRITSVILNRGLHSGLFERPE